MALWIVSGGVIAKAGFWEEELAAHPKEDPLATLAGRIH